MFVSAILDPGSPDTAKALAWILTRYEFVKVQRACWEHAAFTEKKLNDLKKDIDRVTDYYDCVRLYQFPVNGNLAITEMQKKKWRRSILRPV
ncbi:MAG: CRISPR-associated protein Cas2 [Treponema sp.]|nr:CRISPR-associated protein Cas2 [Treponema sp.]